MDRGGVFQREAEADGGAVVEDVDGVFGDGGGELGEEGGDGGGDGVEGVGVGGADGGEAEAWEVWGEDVVFWGEEGDEVAVLVGGGREAVEEEDGGEVGGAGFAVEDGFAGGEGEEAGYGCEKGHNFCEMDSVYGCDVYMYVFGSVGSCFDAAMLRLLMYFRVQRHEPYIPSALSIPNAHLHC